MAPAGTTSDCKKRFNEYIRVYEWTDRAQQTCSLPYIFQITTFLREFLNEWRFIQAMFNTMSCIVFQSSSSIDLIS